MQKFYHIKVFAVILVITFLANIGYSQGCSSLTASYISYESRCTSTGSIQINATGGSGNYHYKVTGPVNTVYTASSLITGLSAGNYLVTIRDNVTNCIYTNDTVAVSGDYYTPSFTLAATGVSCINGNDGTITLTGQTFGRAPFSYKIVAPSASQVGTVSPTGNFTGLISGNYTIQLTDSCGAIQARIITVDNYDWFIDPYTATKIGCDSISVTIILNDTKSNVTPNPIFNGFGYGASVVAGDTTWYPTYTFHYFVGNKHTVKLFAKDICGNIKMVVWRDTAIPNVNASVSVSNKACSTFTAAITNQVNLTSPDYCIYDSSNVLISCNTTGIFNALRYGSYCIKITDNCYDTIITRCFTGTRPIPAVALNVTINASCSSFTATVSGQINLNNPGYCLFNAANVLMYCNTTGVFPGVAFGAWCIKIINDPACYDTTIVRCFTVNPPVPYINPYVLISNLSCSTFTATIIDTANWNNPQFCLFTPAHVLITCNSTGEFNNLTYGNYCIDVINGPGCYDTTITRCFTVNRFIPSLGSYVNITNQTCTTFSATITGLSNLIDPQFCLYNNANVLLGCNETGSFDNIPYGNYCIKMTNNPACYDTVITRCFSASALNPGISDTAIKSCATLGTTNITITINSGTPAFTIKLYSPANVLLQTIVTNSNSYTFINLPGLVSPLKYKIVVSDFCGGKDSVYTAPQISIVNRVINVIKKCPSGTWANGSGDVMVDINDNNIGGNIIPKIIKKNGISVIINASSSAGYRYTFLDLEPAIYILDTYINDCNKHVYDTLIIGIYFYPGLIGTKAYPCDIGGFAISVATTGGIAPYMYEIIGSVPEVPSIVTPPQTNPVFTVNNGTNYSLVRLRVVDGCGNASLYDASILPLANFIVMPDNNDCFDHDLTLRVDSIANAVYTWYKRIPVNDSMIVGTGPSYYIANITPGDTGRYFCKIVVNNGCVIKFANYVVTGGCLVILPNKITLSGRKKEEGNELIWNAGFEYDNDYILQKSNFANIDYQTIYTARHNSNGIYKYLDTKSFLGYNFYRLITKHSGNNIKTSNIVLIKNVETSFAIYPNPVVNDLYISTSNRGVKNFRMELNNAAGQKIMSEIYNNIPGAVIKYRRKPNMKPGFYILTITNLQNNDKEIYRVIYE